MQLPCRRRRFLWRRRRRTGTDCKVVRQRDEEHLHHVVEVHAREADPQRVDEDDPCAKGGGKRVQAHYARCGEGERHKCRAAKRRQQPLWCQGTFSRIRRRLLVRARRTASIAECARYPEHAKLRQWRVYVEKVCAFVVPIEEAAHVRLVVYRRRRAIQAPKPRKCAK